MQFWHKNIDGVHAFYINGLLRSLFMSLTTIFIPVYIYSLGIKAFGLVSYAIMAVAIFFIVQRALIVFLVFPLSKIIERIGFRKSITWSVVFLMISTVSLLLAQNNILYLWVATGAMGLNIPLYWISRDSALSQDIEGSRMGTKMGYVTVLENIAGLLGPFAGGAMVALFGYSSLFVFSLAILGLSTIPLYWMPPHMHKNGVSLAGFWYFLKDNRYLHQAVANFGSAMNDYGNGIIWPLILFIQGFNSENLGTVYSLVAIVTIGVQYLSGKWFDRLRAREDYADEGVFGIASFGIAITWLVRLFGQGIRQIVPIDMSRQLFSSIHANFYADYLHLGGKRMGSIAFWVYAEVVYSLGAIFIFSLMVLGVYLDIWKELVIGTLALWSLVTIVIARESNMR
ncbi:MFS transporter [Candidatus Woesebacteria bacterium]|nr:MFS transporter [Candidatus Woesebacteria bacterium]